MNISAAGDHRSFWSHFPTKITPPLARFAIEQNFRPLRRLRPQAPRLGMRQAPVKGPFAKLSFKCSGQFPILDLRGARKFRRQHAPARLHGVTLKFAAARFQSQRSLQRLLAIKSHKPIMLSAAQGAYLRGNSSLGPILRRPESLIDAHYRIRRILRRAEAHRHPNEYHTRKQSQKSFHTLIVPPYPNRVSIL